ncbi:arsenic transporter [Dactylosporangium roseum]|uniref:Arsenic transporter n=1 Tax=Dactylosporangium roseum TaxID=47989 RepID=A0ABY5YXG9_9ACTN|nr:SLC13 family permease [Dactylosporangium roseum]UWZ34445.1 arsenic transporter [Dactylosporangium roseum]
MGTLRSQAKQPEVSGPPFVRRLGVLDWIAIIFAVLGLLAVATGLVPIPAAAGTVRRLLPLLIFLGSVIVLAELTAAAEVFDVIAARLARTARGNYFALFLMCVGFASITTATLNLDTTAVLLTPVMLATAVRIGMPKTPLAMTTVWLANTASLLLPVSNLTNLLAMNRVQLSSSQFAARLWLVELASVAATMACLWLFYWRRGARHEDRYPPPSPYRPRDRSLFVVAAGSCVIFVVGLLVGVPIQLVSPACMAVVLLAFAVRHRAVLTPRMIPWQLLAFVTGLFLTVDAITAHGLAGMLRSLVGDDTGPWGTLRAAGIGAVLSNAGNNLPAYVAIEAVIPASQATHDQLLGLLIGTNVGPLITPWASLATLIWYARCRGYGVDISWPRFLLTGTVTAFVALSAATGVLILTR